MFILKYTLYFGDLAEKGYNMHLLVGLYRILGVEL